MYFKTEIIPQVTAFSCIRVGIPTYNITQKIYFFLN